MISVYDIGNGAFEKNGDVILKPTRCSVKNIAAGNYELTMDHPIDPDGKWAHLVPEAIVKAPIPAELIENAFAGLDVDVYVTTSKAALRSGPSEPTRITYQAFVVSTTPYAVGTKVTWSDQNYQCVALDPGWPDTGYIHTPQSEYWKEISNYTSGSPVLIQMKSGTEIYYVSGPSSGWYKMSTTYGLEGYVKSSQVSYEKHLTPSETHDRLITEQLFRIKKVTVDTKQMNVNVSAEHVSYDLNGVLIDHVKVVRQPAAQAIAWIEAAFLIDYRGTIASDIISSTDRLYTAEISGRNATYALLDPDKGVVAQFQAAFRRDNWDLFVMEKNNTDRGFRLRYSNNLLGVNWKIGSDQLITRIVPVAKDEDGNELFVDDTTIWVDSAYISNYPVVRMERLKVAGQVGKDDGSETATNWTKASLRAEMLKQAQSRFNVDKCDQYKHELTVDFTRLGDTEEYKQFRDLQVLRLYDSVIIQDPRIDLSVSAQVTEIEFDAVNERVTAMKLSNIEGYNVRNVAGFNVLNNSINSNKLTDDAGDEIIDEAVDEAGEYTDKKATQTLNQSKNYTESYTASYVGDNHGYSSFEAYIKAYCDQNYAPKS